MQVLLLHLLQREGALSLSLLQPGLAGHGGQAQVCLHLIAGLDTGQPGSFFLLRSLEFFAEFGDVQLWEVVRRARCTRAP